VQIFEGVWGEIGWELQRCKKADDLIRVCTPVAVPGTWFREAMMLFCHPSSEPGSGATLTKIRAERRALVEPMRVADESNRRATEQLRQVDWALTQAHGSSRRLVKRARKKRRNEAWKATQQYRTLYNSERRLEKRLKDLEPSFARQELIRFLKSKRYSLRPLNLANATAGLPFMGWRQSMYQIFKAIRYLTSTANKKTENGLVITFEDSIPSLPSRYQLPKTELAEKWFYLERAIRKAYRTKMHPKALPFEITKQYFKQLQSQSQVDMVLSEQARLTLSKPH
jgi:hypothetical protein